MTEPESMAQTVVSESARTPRRAVVFGAGAVGRGFVGPLFSAAGWHVTYVDVLPALIDTLNADGRYRQIVVDNHGRRAVWVGPVDAVAVSDANGVIRALVRADMAATAVGAANLGRLAPLIAAGLAERRRHGALPLDFLLCENLHDVGGVLRAALDEAHGGDTSELAGLAATSVGRMIPSETQDPADPSAVVVEPYAQLPYDASALLNSRPDVPGLVPVRHFGMYGDRKLYIHNMGHCMLAYLAHARGLTYVWEAVELPELRYLVHTAMTESAAALAAVHHVSIGPLFEHVNDLLYRFGNRALGDTSARVGRDPERKMQVDDRLLGAYRLCRTAGVVPLHVSLAVALGAHQLESESGWTTERTEQHLDQHLFEQAGSDPRLRQLLWDQRDLVSRKADVAAHVQRIGAEFSMSRIT